ncbi:DUF5107 domain-containing protein [Cohnella sp. WQ 127256]|uniref:DUF5107 domain-containing protein n=1 Tax=Cohnella sp. WQ 127256 TaxID=2938790 RepID=UPI0021192F91|nr:DUF5107 domain-containing protein [Cohnella sp. WQ 127256]
MAVYQSELLIEGAELNGENPLPIFRSRTKDQIVKENGTLSSEQKIKLGYETGVRVLPYRIQDRYTREKKMMTLKTIILENNILQAVFLPDYGGRLYSLVDKRTNRELLFRNPVMQPANLAIRNAWFSGGIEWNIGHFGHTFTTCSPLHAAKLTDDEGNEFLRIYEYERCKNVFWQIDFHLPPDSENLCIYVRVNNDNAASVPMYWWTNAAVAETKQVRVFSSTDEVIFLDSRVRELGAAKLPHLPMMPDVDLSYPNRFPFSCDYFFQNPEEVKAPWEAVAYEDGRLVYNRSTARLRYNKMFCWGSHAGGRRWCDFLAKPGEGDYIEIQAGFSPTQLHGLDQPATTAWDFTQLYGVANVDANQAHEENWKTARKYIDDEIEQLLPEDEVYRIHDKLQSYADREPKELLHTGSGWGALERLRREKKEGRSTPAGLRFEVASLSAAQHVWLELLETGRLPDSSIDDIPASWMVQDEWRDMLQDSLSERNNESWAAYMHLGVMLYEQGAEEEAIEAWERSLQLRPSAWVYRNLAETALRKEDTDAALSYMKQIIDISNGFPDVAFAEEYISLLIQSGQRSEAWSVYKAMPDSTQANQRLQIIVAPTALEKDEFEFLERLFATEVATLREGDKSIVELWYQYHARKMALKDNLEITDELVARASALFPLPPHIDFRMN